MMTIPTEEYRTRMAKAQARMKDLNVDWLLLAPGSDLRYLTGLNARVSERLNLLALPQQGQPRFYAPALEAMTPSELAMQGVFDLSIWQEDENPVRLIARDIARQAIDGGNISRTASIAVSDQMWSVFLLRLQEVIREANWQSAAQVIEPLRIIKSAAELAALAEIGAAADDAFGEIIKERFSGRREVEIADILGQLLRAGGHEVAKFAIVASGPNGASPHHDAGERMIEAGDFVVLDFGGPGHHGYGSDISRTVFVAGDAGLTPTVEQLKVYNTVKEAQELAFQAIRPGIEAQALDKVARDHIAAAGYGDAFLHRLGHGIGLDGHETPYLVHGNATKIEPGMAFSDEPGIYLAGKFGVRIEDIVYCAESCGVRCNEATRELVMVKLSPGLTDQRGQCIKKAPAVRKGSEAFSANVSAQ